MKAIVMAGGEGTRLRPLTCDLPKPMVPFFDKPVMEHQIDLLRRHGFRDIGVTTAYLPNMITDYFGDGKQLGVNISYFNEQTPLGTAGSVKNAGDFIDETFIVISGDAVTDIDLSEAMRFHKEKDAQITIVLKQVDIPLEYGVVVTDENGRIVRFLEKPDWGEVFSDTANTGIYIINPEIMQDIPKGEQFDFARQLFPMQLEKGVRMYGYVAQEYWCDIGDITQYMQAHQDALDGRLRLDMGRQIAPGVFTRLGKLPEGCDIKTPVYIGADADIEYGCRIGEYAVIGAGCELGYGTSVKRSIIWQHAHIGSSSELRGSIVCDSARLGMNARIFEGSVVGGHTIAGDNITLRPGKLIWPGKRIAANANICDNIVWGNGTHTYSGGAMREMNVRRAAAVGFALGSMHSGGNGVGIACSHYAAASALRLAANGGICSAGSKVLDMGFATLPAMRHQIKKHGLAAGLYVDYKAGSCEFRFFDEKEFGREKLQKLNSLIERADMISRPEKAEFSKAYPLADMQYAAYLAERFSGGNKRVLCFGPGAEHTASVLAKSGNKPVLADVGLKQAALMIPGAFAMGIATDINGEDFLMLDDRGRELTSRDIWALRAYAATHRLQPANVYIPGNAAVGLMDYARSIGARMSASGDADVYHSAAGFAAALTVALTLKQQSLYEALHELPGAAESSVSMSIQPEKIAVVMRRLSGEAAAQPAGRGIAFEIKNGVAEVFPDISLPGIRILGSAYSAEVAEELAADLARIARQAIQEDT